MIKQYLYEILISGGVAWFVGKLAFKQAVIEITHKKFEELEDKIRDVADMKKQCSKEYVSTHYCAMQHSNVAQLIQSVNDKLDILIERGVH